jgi:shikimate dehydrogenase
MNRPELYAVFGHPIGHSLSPRMHEAAFRSRGWSHRRYIAVDVDRADLTEAVAAFRRLGGLGVNLTRPLKEEAAASHWLIQQDAWARAAEAVNTLAPVADGWAGTNTDAPALQAALETRGIRPRRALILGSGGAARATWRALQTHAQVTVASRRPAPFVGSERWVPWGAWPHSSQQFDLIVNCTPLGQDHEPAMAPLPAFRPGQTAVDWVYVPRATAFLSAARDEGAETVDGLELLARQAALSWVTWFGQPGPWEVMLAAAEDSC